MRYVPSTKHGSLLIGSLRTAAKAHAVEPELATRVITNTAEHLEAREDTSFKTFKTVDHQIAEYFMKWAEALQAGDHHKANHYSDLLDKEAEAHPFTYPETKSIFYAHYRDATYAQALKQYLPAKPTTDPGFGIVTKQLNDDATVGIFGDWGTGTQDAQVLFQAMMGHKPDVLLHLGDIYEAAMPIEIEEYFLKPIGDTCAALGVAQPPIFTIPGNHEYFSGAKGYFQLIKVLNQGIDPDWAQDASFFCLRSADQKWQFLGADTGLGCIDAPSTPALEPDEQQWHRDRIAEFPGKTVMMTHHQFVAADQGIYHHRPQGTHYEYRYFNPYLVDAFDAPVPNCPNGDTYLDRISLWMWGHDHYFIPYAPNLSIPKIDGVSPRDPSQPKLPLGQLLGGSARETQASKRSVGQSRWSWTQTDSSGAPIKPDAANEGIVNHTYAILKLATGQVSYYQVPAWDGSVDLQNPPPGLATDPIAAPLLTNTL